MCLVLTVAYLAIFTSLLVGIGWMLFLLWTVTFGWNGRFWRRR